MLIEAFDFVEELYLLFWGTAIFFLEGSAAFFSILISVFGEFIREFINTVGETTIKS